MTGHSSNDPYCGSGGMFVQSVEFVNAHANSNGNGGKIKATPGRYVGAAEVEDDSEPFEEKVASLTTALRGQTEQAAKFDHIIWANLEDIGYGG